MLKKRRCIYIYITEEIGKSTLHVYIYVTNRQKLSILPRSSQAINTHALYCNFLLPYVSHCTEVLVNTYLSKISPVHVKQKKAIQFLGRLNIFTTVKNCFIL